MTDIIQGSTSVEVQTVAYEVAVPQGGDAELLVTMPSFGPPGPKGETGSQGPQGERGYSSLEDVDLPNFVLIFENGLI